MSIFRAHQFGDFGLVASEHVAAVDRISGEGVWCLYSVQTSVTDLDSWLITKHHFTRVRMKIQGLDN